MTLESRKRELRQAGRAAVGRLAATDLAERSARVRAGLERESVFHDAGLVLAFMALAGEGGLGPILGERLLRGLPVALPRADWSPGEMEAAAVRHLDQDVVTGRHGLREPRATMPPVDPGRVEVALVPGLVFDPRGGRLGRGAGFYDRFLGRLPPGTPTIGVCFRIQVVREVPMGPDDRRVTMLATEDGVVECR